MSTRARLALVALVPILGLFGLLILAPPDGLERAALAQFFGHFHPLAVHMPIALLLLVPLMEIAGANPRRAHIRAAAAFVLGLGLIAAIVTPLLGWLLAWSGGYEGALVTRHMWGGAALATACWITWMLRGHSAALYRVALLATVGLIAWTGYPRGQLAHRGEQLTQHMPQTPRSLFGLPAIAGHGAPDGDPATFYGARIAPIFKDHCLLCHSAEKHRGGLRLGTYAAIMHGGKDGPVVVPGHPPASELHRRSSLPDCAKNARPAQGRPQLSAADMQLIRM